MDVSEEEDFIPRELQGTLQIKAKVTSRPVSSRPIEVIPSQQAQQSMLSQYQLPKEPVERVPRTSEQKNRKKPVDATKGRVVIDEVQRTENEALAVIELVNEYIRDDSDGTGILTRQLSENEELPSNVRFVSIQLDLTPSGEDLAGDRMWSEATTQNDDTFRGQFYRIRTNQRGNPTWAEPLVTEEDFRPLDELDAVERRVLSFMKKRIKDQELWCGRIWLLCKTIRRRLTREQEIYGQERVRPVQYADSSGESFIVTRPPWICNYLPVIGQDENNFDTIATKGERVSFENGNSYNH